MKKEKIKMTKLEKKIDFALIISAKKKSEIAYKMLVKIFLFNHKMMLRTIANL
jgi:hypothetical protein